MNRTAVLLPDDTRISVLRRTHRFLLLTGLLAGVSSVLPAQSLALVSVGQQPDNSILLNLSLSTSGIQPAALQFAFSYSDAAIASLSVAGGPALTSPQKSLYCNGNAANYICVAAGLNDNTISDGVVATVSVTLAAGVNTASISVSNTLGADSVGNAYSLAASGPLNISLGSMSVVCSPPVLSFAFTPGGAAPANETCAITTTPGGLSLSAGTSAVGGSWLSAGLSAQTSPATLTVSADPSGLAAGGYTGTVSVSATGAATSNLPVNLTVNPAPSLRIAKTHSGNFAQGQSNALYTVSVSNSAGSSPTNGVVIVTEQLPTGLTLVSMAGSGWTCSNGACMRSDALAGGSSYPPVTVAVNVSPGAASPQVNSVSVTGGGSAAANATDSTAIDPVTPVTIQTSPAGMQFTVDGGTVQTAPQTLSLIQGLHSLAVAVTQPGPAGTQYTFTGWSDGGTASHFISVGSSAATIVASFNTQYQLTISASPAAGGILTPASGNFYDSGSIVLISATANTGYAFIGWSGDLSNTNPPYAVMNAAHSVTANFASTSSCSLSFTSTTANLPATGTSTPASCPDPSQSTCGFLPEAPLSFTVLPSAACGAWTATSSNPAFLQVISGPGGNGAGNVSFRMLANTHTTQRSATITVASGTTSADYLVTQAGSPDGLTYREVYALYEQLLGRDPDSGGFAFWTGLGGLGLGQMADSFVTSPEAFGSNFAVMAAYQAALGTPPTYAQFTAALTAIRAGTQTVSGLFSSLIGANYTAANLYRNLLNRQALASEITAANTAGLPSWFQTLIGYPAGTTIGAANNEFQSTGSYRTDHTNALYVQMLYFVILSRDPDPGGISFWLGVANGGGPGVLFQGSAGFNTRIQILGAGTPNEGFIGSPEFQGLFAN